VPDKDNPEPSKYTTVIQDARFFAIGDGARVEVAGDSAEPSPPQVSLALLTHTLPTATCHHLTAQEFPFVTVTLDNSGQGCGAATVRVTAVIEAFSDTVSATVQLAPGEQMQIVLLPLLQATAVATLSDIRPATVRVTAVQTQPERLLFDQTTRIHLHARDTALLAVRATDGSLVDMTRYLAAWVTPRITPIEQLLRQAARHHPARQFVGYQGAKNLDQARQVVGAQAEAIFTALKQDAQVVYINSPLNLGAAAGQIMQRVRLPSLSLQTPGSANCIDGAVLFASLLELAAIDPLLVIVPGHAFVGWRIWDGVEQYDFLETTLIGSSDFAAAQQVGQQQYEEALMKGYFNRGLFDPAGFARLIDVAACRAQAIYPLE
jgi:hypothetical protein